MVGLPRVYLAQGDLTIICSVFLDAIARKEMRMMGFITYREELNSQPEEMPALTFLLLMPCTVGVSRRLFLWGQWWKEEWFQLPRGGFRML